MVQPSEQQIDDARESLVAHIEELGRRFRDVKDKLDIRAHISAHPRAAAAIAFGAGALLAFPRRRAKPDAAAVKSGMFGAAMTMLGSLAFTLAKNVAMQHLSGSAKAWWDEHMERDASRSQDMESFLEH
jgi:hypothetical protein